MVTQISERNAERARQFAEALDVESYEAARALLRGDCIYEGPDGQLRGVDAIVASYRAHGERAAELDEVVYESSVQSCDEHGAVVLFVDHLSHGGQTHTYRCRQRLRFNGDLIDRIVHEEIGDERERLLEFLARVGASTG